MKYKNFAKKICEYAFDDINKFDVGNEFVMRQLRKIGMVKLKDGYYIPKIKFNGNYADFQFKDKIESNENKLRKHLEKLSKDSLVELCLQKFFDEKMAIWQNNVANEEWGKSNIALRLACEDLCDKELNYISNVGIPAVPQTKSEKVKAKIEKYKTEADKSLKGE